MKKYDVAALGELLIDFTENGVSPQGNPIFEANPGGAPCNVLAILQKLGKKTAFIGKVGKDIFGRQLYLNEKDEVMGEEHQLLVCASGLSIEQVFSLTSNYGGASVPAHIDRSSSSILSNLGFIPPDLPVSALEITAKGRAELEQKYAGFRILTNSDAHYLEDIAEPEFSLDLEEKSIDCFLHYLWGK